MALGHPCLSHLPPPLCLQVPLRERPRHLLAPGPCRALPWLQAGWALVRGAASAAGPSGAVFRCSLSRGSWGGKPGPSAPPAGSSPPGGTERPWGTRAPRRDRALHPDRGRDRAGLLRHSGPGGARLLTARRPWTPGESDSQGPTPAPRSGNWTRTTQLRTGQTKRPPCQATPFGQGAHLQAPGHAGPPVPLLWTLLPRPPPPQHPAAPPRPQERGSWLLLAWAGVRPPAVGSSPWIWPCPLALTASRLCVPRAQSIRGRGRHDPWGACSCPAGPRRSGSRWAHSCDAGPGGDWSRPFHSGPGGRAELSPPGWAHPFSHSCPEGLTEPPRELLPSGVGAA